MHRGYAKVLMATFMQVCALLRLMSVDARLSSSNRSLKKLSDKQRKRRLDSPGPLCSTLPVNAPQSVCLQKTEACQGRARGRCYREENTWKQNIKSSNNGKRASKGNTAWCIHFWQKVEEGGKKRVSRWSWWRGALHSDGLIKIGGQKSGIVSDELLWVKMQVTSGDTSVRLI